MKQPLEQIIHSLELDSLYAVKIINAETFRVLCTNKTGLQMTDEAESVTGYFNDVFESNKSIVIQPQRKNGNNYRTVGEPVKISVEPRDKEQPQNITYPTTTPALTPEIIAPGLMGGMQGLNAQIIYNHMDYSRVIALNSKLEAENEKLKDKIAELKEEALENKFSESKATGNKDMLQGLMGIIPEILTAVGTMKNGQTAAAVATAGLGHPEPELSPVKQNLTQWVKSTSDAVNSYIVLVYEGIGTVKEFGPELEQLLIRHNLIKSNNE